MKTVLKFFAALGLTLALVMAHSHEAEARKGRGAAFAAGIAAGVIGLGILGAAEAEARRSGGGCYKGRRVCDVIEHDCFYSRSGDYICPAPERRCYRPTICD
jgi:hypothetical protein